MSTSAKKKGAVVAMSAAAAAMVVALIGDFEGLRLNAYPDPVTLGKPWTICYGSTKGVNPGDKKTLEECNALLAKESNIYWIGIYSCTSVPLPMETAVALTSFAYNVGVPTACRSSVVRLINEGKLRQGCDALMRYDGVNIGKKHIRIKGLVNRRTLERDVCLKGAV